MNPVGKRLLEKYGDLIQRVEQKRAFNIMDRDQIEALLAVGVSCHDISDYLEINLRVIKKICARWKQTKLPQILQQRAES